MGYSPSFILLAGFFIFASATGDDCFDCLQEDDIQDVAPPLPYSSEQQVHRTRKFYIIIPVGIFVLLCKWYLYCCCKRQRRGAIYRNRLVETTDVVSEPTQLSASEISHHQNLQQQQEQQLLVVPLPNPVQSVVLPAQGCKYPGIGAWTQPTDQPPSYSEAIAIQPSDNHFINNK